MNKEAKKLDPQPRLVDVIISGIQEKKGQRIVSLDMQHIENTVTDHFVICHGSSNTQVESIAETVEKRTREELNEKPWHIEGSDNASWILLDYVDVVAHIFHEEVRDFYDLEGLWADAKVQHIEAGS